VVPQQKKKPTSLRSAPGDQRKFERFEIRMSVFVTDVPTKDSPDSLWYRRRSREQPAVVTDLCVGGLFFLSETSYEIGSQVWVSLVFNGKTSPIRALVRRQNSQLREGKRLYGHGIQFVRSDFATDALNKVVAYLESLITP
jgi:hypothetical protein